MSKLEENVSVDKMLDETIRLMGKKDASDRIGFYLRSMEHVYSVYKQKCVVESPGTVIEKMDDCALTGLSDAIDCMKWMTNYIKAQV